ncbi:MAG: hypothetical protein AB7G17_05010 [Phycisphaerales bacterium]
MTEGLPAAARDLDTRSAEAVVGALRAGSEANLGAACRAGSVDVIRAPGTLVATGDLHDNPMNFARVMGLADLEGRSDTHVTLHEVIHGGSLMGGMDFSYRALARVAALKAAYPERVHALLANHELSQISGMGVVKDGVRMVEAFNTGVEYVFGGESGPVHEAVAGFVRSMPLALIAEGSDGRRVLCAHSLPEEFLMDRFDASVLERALTDADYEPRRGSAHLMVWGRGHSESHVTGLSARWNVDGFVLGHEKAEEGAQRLHPNGVIVNSDHPNGVALVLDLDALPEFREFPRGFRVARVGA